MLAVTHSTLSTDRTTARHPSLMEVAAALQDSFCMVPVNGDHSHWQSGHYELLIDQPGGTITLRFRSTQRQLFKLTLSTRADGRLSAAVKGAMTGRGYEDLVAADEQLDWAILRAVSPAPPGPRSPVPVQLMDVLKVRKPRAPRRAA